MRHAYSLSGRTTPNGDGRSLNRLRPSLFFASKKKISEALWDVIVIRIKGDACKLLFYSYYKSPMQ